MDSFILFLFSLVHFGMCGPFFSNNKLHANCKPIQPTNNLEMEWALSIFGGKMFYLPMGSLSSFMDLHELLQGTRAAGPLDMEGMCAQVRIKAFKSTIEGYEDKYLVIDCPMIKKGMQDCRANPRTQRPKHHQAVKGIQTLAWTDNASAILLVRCSPDGGKNDWMVYANATSLPSETVEVITKEISKMGFTNDSIHIPNYQNCKLIPQD